MTSVAATETRPLLAYAVTEDYENTGAILFARSDIEARKHGANEFNDGEIGGICCRRAPWADAYAGTPMPAWVMIAHGWHFECSGCGERIDSDWLDDQGFDVHGVIGQQYGRVYCCDSCRSWDEAREAVRKAVGAEMIARLSAMLLQRLPGVTIIRTHANARRGESGAYVADECAIHFEYPGQQYGPGEFRTIRRYGITGPLKPAFYCSAGDVKVFEAFAASCRGALDPLSAGRWADDGGRQPEEIDA